MNVAVESALLMRDVRKSFRQNGGAAVVALDGVSFAARRGTLTVLVGPDGAGKSTLIRLAAGLTSADQGEIRVAGLDVASDAQGVQDLIGYMPQRFGLYEDLSAQENLDLYADLHGVSPGERPHRYRQLMEMTALVPFRGRVAGHLSGGMKQKLGLACALVRSPALLLLDEPTVGVDPLSRRELWEIVVRLVREENHTVVVSTSYLDEAERCDHAVVLHAGKVLAQGAPADITVRAQGRTYVSAPPRGQSARRFLAGLLRDPAIIDAVPQAGSVRFICQSMRAPGGDSGETSHRADAAVAAPPRFEDGFMVLLATQVRRERDLAMALERAPAGTEQELAVEVRNLTRRFGVFTAVDHISFNVHRGEIFGLLGPNGAGKTTTFRMLCGLLSATDGTLRVAGADLRTARASARQQIGYVAQKFSLYGQLSVRENLEFFASAYGLRARRKRQRIAWAIEQFALAPFIAVASSELPGGYKQRLAMAAALLHEPDILFLDEATSGADPLARREFWDRINALAEQGVTIIITTHFLEEAEYCDRVVLLDAGSLLAEGTPAEIRRRARPSGKREATMDDAFIAIVGEFRKDNAAEQRVPAA